VSACSAVMNRRMQHNFAHVLLNLADDPDLRQLMGSAGRSLVENEDGWSAIVEHGLKETWGSRLLTSCQ
jgi:hypothetical protein